MRSYKMFIAGVGIAFLLQASPAVANEDDVPFAELIPVYDCNTKLTTWRLQNTTDIPFKIIKDSDNKWHHRSVGKFKTVIRKERLPIGYSKLRTLTLKWKNGVVNTTSWGWFVPSKEYCNSLQTEISSKKASTKLKMYGCKAIVHRATSTVWDEEVPPAIANASRYRFGAEVDVHPTKDGHMVLIHDNSMNRISGGKSQLIPEESTLAQLKAVTLVRGGHIITLEEGLQAAKLSKGKLMIEMKRVSFHLNQWNKFGFKAINNAIINAGMQKKAYVGAADGGAIFHSKYPSIKTFWRTDNGDSKSRFTKKAIINQGYDLVALNKGNMTKKMVKRLKSIDVKPATRTIKKQSVFLKGRNAGIHIFQTNSPDTLRSWCKTS